ncbi:flagellar hook-length control protein FliK [Calidifontibacillus oryziterrae]|uniref:flagellar hook-length control protein FliK n=1 Tax=Calidifontibacillus oryziterrae TaxID=1191699 RepID=UPI000311551B|nr:flagellar hook-length control protein FliK [Calidifontibacillus oryziterrae]
MNAAQLLAIAIPNGGTSIRSQVANQTQQTSNHSVGFSRLLIGALTQAEDATTVEDMNLAAVSDDFDAKLNSIDYEQLFAVFEELFDMLPMTEGYFDQALLQDPDVIALLNQLPQPMQQLLSNFLSSAIAFEQVLVQTEKGSKEQVMLLVMAMLQLEKKGQFPEQMKQIDFVKQLQQQLNEVFKMQLPEQSGNVALLVSKLIQTLEKRTTNDSVKVEAGQPFTQLKTELTQIIQRVLYSEANNQGNPNNPSGQQSANKGTAVNITTEITGTSVPFEEGVFDQLVNSSLKDGGSVNRIQQYVLNVQQPTGSPVSEEQILSQLKNIMKQSKFSTTPNGTNQLMIRLNPAHLGSLTIKLTESNGEMMARIIASTATAKEIIESNLNGLRHVFTSQNITVEKFEINYQGDSQFEGAKKEQNEQDSSKSRQQASEQDANSENESQSDSFKDELLNLIV